VGAVGEAAAAAEAAEPAAAVVTRGRKRRS